MTTRKLWYEEIPREEYEKLAASYNVEGLERLRIDPPLDNSLIQEITAIERVEEVDSEFPDYATILEVSPTVILIEVKCSFCCWKLANKILDALRLNGDVDTDIPSRYSLASGEYTLSSEPYVWRYERKELFV